jgi:hypothetical protein
LTTDKHQEPHPSPAATIAAPRTRGSLYDLFAAGFCLAFVAVVLLSALVPVIAHAG